LCEERCKWVERLILLIFLKAYHEGHISRIQDPWAWRVRCSAVGNFEYCVLIFFEIYSVCPCLARYDSSFARRKI
jgi:hypothetical protein